MSTKEEGISFSEYMRLVQGVDEEAFYDAFDEYPDEGNVLECHLDLIKECYENNLDYFDCVDKVRETGRYIPIDGDEGDW